MGNLKPVSNFSHDSSNQICATGGTQQSKNEFICCELRKVCNTEILQVNISTTLKNSNNLRKYNRPWLLPCINKSSTHNLIGYLCHDCLCFTWGLIHLRLEVELKSSDFLCYQNLLELLQQSYVLC
ncbi:hypothetical protein VPH35_042578 [Triticum aestivum]